MKNIFKNVLMVIMCMVMASACAEEVVIEETELAETIIEEAVVEEVTVDEPQPVDQPEEEQHIECSVSVYVSCADTVWYGDTVTLYAVLKGYDGIDYHIQWQVSDDNSNWHDISGANSEQYSIVVSEENCTNYYRVVVTN